MRDCTSVVWARAEHPGASLGLTGSWNGWEGVSVPLQPAEEGWFVARMRLPAGEHGYLVVENGEPRVDAINPMTTFRGEQEVSLLLVEDCSRPEVRVTQVHAQDDGSVRIAATFLTDEAGDALDAASLRAQAFDGTPFRVQQANTDTGQLVLAADGLPRGKYRVDVRAADRAGHEADGGHAVAWIQSASPRWGDGVLYQIMIDRYRGDGGRQLDPPPTPGSRAGGTLDGVRAAIESGELEDLGVTAVWLSPVYLNPTEAREGPWDGRMYEGYHGYWPLGSRKVDPRLGGEEALHAVVSAAHARGMRVILDIVPNHVYEQNSIYLNHRGDGWFHDGAERCVCGNPSCPWSTHIETCWFTSYLPDYRWKTPEVMRHGSAESLWWVQNFDLDGVRIDAVPMMPRAATRRIALAIRGAIEPSSEAFLLGEIFTGGGQDGINRIRYHLGPNGLDSAFDFPLMWTLRETIAKGTGSFEDVANVLDTVDVSFDGAGATIARIVGNHDTTRFVSEANGDAEGDPWDDPPEQPSDPDVYARHLMAMTLVMTFPGLPVIYYGDELALAGGADPDCRRVMPAYASLDAGQARVLDGVRRLGRLRRCSGALRIGAMVILEATKDTFAYVRDAGDGWPVLVAVSKSSTSTTVSVQGNVLAEGAYVDVLTGESISMGDAGGGATVTLQPLSTRVLIAANCPCK